LSITIRDVAREAGVSIATASRALGNYGYISEEKRALVVEAAHKLGYHPHSLAKSLVTGTTNTVGFVVGDIENPFFASLAKWVNLSLAAEGYTLMVYTTDENVEDEVRGVYSLMGKQVDGMIIAPASLHEYAHILAAQNSGIAVVLVDRFLPNLDVDIVAVDNFKGAYDAVQALIKLGHSEIGFVSDSLDIASNVERLEGYKQALKDAHIPLMAGFIETTGYTLIDGYRKAVSVLSGARRPTAIFAASNFIATGLLLAARDMDVQIPAQVSLISFDDMEWYKLLTPSISVVAQPLEKVGQAVARLLLKRMRKDDRLQYPEKIRIPPHLILRESTAPPPQTAEHLNPPRS